MARAVDPAPAQPLRGRPADDLHASAGTPPDGNLAPWGLIAAWSVVVVSGLITAAFLVFDRGRDMEQAQRLTDANATVVDEQTGGNLQALDQRLELVAQLVGQRWMSEAPAPNLLEPQLRKLPWVGSLHVLDDRGRERGAAGASAASAGVKGEDIVQIYRTRPGTGFELHAPRLAGDPPQWGLVASRPVLDAEGRFAGAVVATVQPDYFAAG